MKNILLFCSAIFFLLILIWGLENFLRLPANPATDDVHIFNMEVWSHDGRKISGNGILKLLTDPFTGYKNFPDQKTKWFNINSHGFRGKEIDKRQKNKRRIIVAGGSAAFGTGVKSDGETFQAMLQNSNDKYEVINAGIPGFLSGQELTYIVTELVDYQPDIIIAYDGFNDLDSQWHHEFFFKKPKTLKELGYNSNFYSFQIENPLVENHKANTHFLYGLKRSLKTLTNKSALFTRLRNKYEVLKTPTISAEIQDNKDNDQSENQYLESIINNYTNNLIKMNDFCRSRNITFLVVLQPELGNKKVKSSRESFLIKSWAFGTSNYIEEFPPLYEKFLYERKNVLKKNNVPYLDINRFSEFTDNKETLFTDVVHTNAAGNKVIAEIIKRYLVKLENGKAFY